MNVRKALWAVGLAVLGLSLNPSFASAATITRLPDFTDDDFREALTTGEFTELFVAEGRIANNALNGDRELGINDVNFNPVTQRQFVWTNGKIEDFLLEYDGSKVTYSVGNVALVSNVFSGLVNNIYIRTRETARSNLLINNLFLNGVALGANAFSEPSDSDPDDVDYLRISGIKTPFKLTGQVTMSWTGNRPNGSNLAYQIKVGPATDIPEPGTVGALLLTGMAAVTYRKKKQQSI